MNTHLKDLIKSAACAALDEQTDAVFQLAMLLERNTRPSNEAGFYESVLSADLLKITLDKSQQQEILAKLLSTNKIQRVLPSLLWAIGKALPEAGMPLLLDLVHQHPNLLTGEAAYQAAIAFENFLDRGKDATRAAAVEQAFKDTELLDFLRHTSAQDSKSAEPAHRLVKRLLKKKAD